MAAFEGKAVTATAPQLLDFNSLICWEESLFLELFSLLIRLGKYLKVAAGTRVSVPILVR
jgi:hypothetical protein